MEKNNKSSVSLNLGTILFLIFLTLKLAGLGVVATWSWWWVCSPLWISFAIILFIIGIASVVLMLRDVFNLFK
jgi:hypothetical protein